MDVPNVNGSCLDSGPKIPQEAEWNEKKGKLNGKGGKERRSSAIEWK